MDYAAYIQAIMSAVGTAVEAGERKKAQALLAQARQRFEGIMPPELEALEQQLGPSALEQVRPDAQADTAQREALRQALQMASDGFSPEDEAALIETSNRIGQTARNQREGIAASMAQRGGTGSGADYALQADAADNAAMRANESQKRIQAEALRRRAQGVQTAGAMASSLRGQKYGEDSRLAAARDTIASQNANYRRAAAQQRYENEMGRARAIAGATSPEVAAGIANGQYISGAMNRVGADTHDLVRGAQAQAYQQPAQQPQADPEDEWERWDPSWSGR